MKKRQSTLLSIAIPTYNREKVFIDNLLEIILKVREYNIPIYISDNNSSDQTYSKVLSLKKEYEYLYIEKNSENLGFDRNVAKVLTMPKSKYIWLLGDDDIFRSDKLDMLLEKLNSKDYDMVVLNSDNRISDIESKEYNDADFLLAELGWHMTFMSCLIYSRELIKDMDYKDYKECYFTHFAVAFISLAGKKFNLLWLKDRFIKRAKNADSEMRWLNQLFEIFLVKFSSLVLSFPLNYSLKSKLDCILKHNTNTNIFTYQGFAILRQNGALNFKSYKKYKAYFPLATKVGNLYLIFLLCFPSKLLYFPRYVYRAFRYKLFKKR